MKIKHVRVKLIFISFLLPIQQKIQENATQELYGKKIQRKLQSSTFPHSLSLSLSFFSFLNPLLSYLEILSDFRAKHMDNVGTKSIESLSLSAFHYNVVEKFCASLYFIQYNVRKVMHHSFHLTLFSMLSFPSLLYTFRYYSRLKFHKIIKINVL